MRLLRGDGANPLQSRREVQSGGRAEGPGGPRWDKGILQLADHSAALREGRVRRRLRYSARDVRGGRASPLLRRKRHRAGERLALRKTVAAGGRNGAATPARCAAARKRRAQSPSVS